MIDARISEAWQRALATFMVSEAPEFTEALSHVSDMASARFVAASIPMVDDPRFTDSAPTFARLCCLEVARDWILTNRHGLKRT